MGDFQLPYGAEVGIVVYNREILDNKEDRCGVCMRAFGCFLGEEAPQRARTDAEETVQYCGDQTGRVTRTHNMQLKLTRLSNLSL